jgi:hypothetical protein
MNRTLSNLGPILFLAVVMLVATALVVAAPRAPWTAVAGPLLLAFAPVGTDLVQRRRAGRRLLPSPSVLLLGATILFGCWIVASSGLDRLAAMMPIFGSCAALPAILSLQGAHRSCRPA